MHTISARVPSTVAKYRKTLEIKISFHCNICLAVCQNFRIGYLNVNTWCVNISIITCYCSIIWRTRWVIIINHIMLWSCSSTIFDPRLILNDQIYQRQNDRSPLHTILHQLSENSNKNFISFRGSFPIGFVMHLIDLYSACKQTGNICCVSVSLSLSLFIESGLI